MNNQIKYKWAFDLKYLKKFQSSRLILVGCWTDICYSQFSNRDMLIVFIIRYPATFHRWENSSWMSGDIFLKTHGV